MSKIRVEAKADYLRTVSKESPFKALAEIIWNGFDANATEVNVQLNMNIIDSLDSIVVIDDGDGIDPNRINEFFGGLGGSWKKRAKLSGNRNLHGEKGRGRFKSFALGEKVTWETKFLTPEGFYKFDIYGDVNTIDEVVLSEKNICSGKSGTSVLIENLVVESNALLSKDASVEVAKIFCLYLAKNPNKRLIFNGIHIEPELAQKRSTSYNLGDVYVGEGKTKELKLVVVEWVGKADRIINFCDEDGYSLCDYKIGQRIHAPNCDFSLFALSPYFHELNNDGLLQIDDLSSEVRYLIDAVIDKARDHFTKLAIAERSKVVQSWINDGIYPYDNLNEFDIVENAERQVFDILAVNVQSYLKKFEKSDLKTKKFTFRLLQQALKDNPESVQKIVAEVLNLKKEEREDLADLLEKTTLSAVISASKTVVGRLEFLKALEQLIFDKDTKKSLLERDHLHKVLEKEAWVFREDFNLSGSEVRLNEVLELHKNKLGIRENTDKDVLRPDGSSGRVDLMLSKTRQPREGHLEHMVVELKRPSQKIDANVIAQIKSYAFTVARDARFDKESTEWTFIAVSNEFDDYAAEEASQHDRPKGLIHNKGNIKIWIYTWSQVINLAKARLSFYKEQLNYEAGRESAVSYLKAKHEKFIPSAILSE
ncbi:ATP-binding protein [Enterobacter mori]|uniref:ATP-binding protein n=2 Tax=Enterobacter mori TaxID=539813 RepID=UPI0032AF147D